MKFLYRLLFQQGTQAPPVLSPGKASAKTAGPPPSSPHHGQQNQSGNIGSSGGGKKSAKSAGTGGGSNTSGNDTSTPATHPLQPQAPPLPPTPIAPRHLPQDMHQRSALGSKTGHDAGVTQAKPRAACNNTPKGDAIAHTADTTRNSNTNGNTNGNSNTSVGPACKLIPKQQPSSPLLAQARALSDSGRQSGSAFLATAAVSSQAVSLGSMRVQNRAATTDGNGSITTAATPIAHPSQSAAIEEVDGEHSSTLTARHLGHKFILSATASSIAEAATFPLDLIKTRIMIASHTHLSAVGTLSSIVREEGVRRLWFGATPAVLRHVVYGGLRLTIYEILRDSCETQGFNKATFIACGFASGIVSQFVASPTDLLKVRLSGQGNSGRYRNTAHAFSSIVKTEGVLGLWKGCIPNVQRAAIVNLSDMASYDLTKRVYVSKFGDNFTSQTLASLTSSFITAIFSTPADLIKTRVMNQEVVAGRGAQYKGVFDCLRKTVAKEGVPALWKGFLPNWMRMAPWSFVFWITYERLRKITGQSSF